MAFEIAWRSLSATVVQSLLTRIILLLLLEEKTAQCDKCGKFFKNSHNVRNHQSRMHPGKPETFPYYCDKCGQGTHNLTAHRCIVPGEMHGSRRRRAPRSSLQSASAAANAGETLVDRSMPAELPPAPLVSSSPLTPKPDDRNLETPRVIGDTQVGVVSPETVDCRSSTATCGQSSDYRLGGLPAPPAVEVGITAASSHSVDRHSSARAVASHQQHADRYPSPVTQPFDRHLVPSAANVSFDHDSSQHLDRRLTTGARSSYGNPHHHHHPVTMPDVEPPYDRRVPPPFEHHLPVMAHQPPQQPAYSNLFAVDPLLQVQLRAANMMYRMDY